MTCGISKYKGFAISALYNCRILLVSANLDGFQRAVVLACKIVFAGRNIAVNAGILSHCDTLLNIVSVRAEFRPRVAALIL